MALSVPEITPVTTTMSRTNAIIAHLRATAAAAPEYREVLQLFLAIHGYLDGREGLTGLTVTAPADRRQERPADGRLLLAPEALQVDRHLFPSFFDGLLAVLQVAGKEGGESLTALGAGISDGCLDPARLFTAILTRDRAPLTESAARCGIPAALLEFVLEIPLKTALSRYAATLPPEAAQGWQQGHCPVCGGRAGMAELAGDEGRRYLSCSCCSFRWPFPRLTCPYCGCADPEQLSYLTVGDELVRVDTCRNCCRYIKTRDTRRGGADVPLEAVDLTTIHLELLAVREGFERGK